MQKTSRQAEFSAYKKKADAFASALCFSVLPSGSDQTPKALRMVAKSRFELTN